MTEAIHKLVTNFAESHLLDRPQRLGILPTFRFWHDEDNWELVNVPIAIGVALLGVVLVLSDLPVPLYVIAVIPGAALVLVLGVLERYIRHQAEARRALRETEEVSSREP